MRKTQRGNGGARRVEADHVTAVVVLLPLRLRSTLNVREHWAKRHRRSSEERAVVRMALARQMAWPLRLPVEVTITRIAPRALDGDNLQGACKAVRDGIADALGVDDGDDGIAWSYGQRRGQPRQYAVEVRICERAPSLEPVAARIAEAQRADG